MNELVGCYWRGEPNKSDLARAAGVSAITVAAWLRRKDCPKIGRKGIGRSEWLQYAKERTEAAADAQRGDNADEKKRILRLRAAKLEEEIRRAKVEFQRAEIGLQKDKGAVVSVEEHLDTVTVICRRIVGASERVRQKLLGDARDPAFAEAINEMADAWREAVAEELRKNEG